MRSAVLEKPQHEDAVITAAPDFSRLVYLYRWMEWFSFGPFLWRCRCAFLELMRNRRNALVIGDGDGRFTAHLLRYNARISIEALDASAAMLSAMSHRAGSNRNRLETHIADARSFHPLNPEYDLITTHFFLDCLTTPEVESLATRLRGAVSKDAVWIVSEFAVPSGWYGRAIAKPLISGLYLAFGWMTGLTIRQLPQHRKALAQAGWSLDREQQWLGGMLVSEVWRPL